MIDMPLCKDGQNRDTLTGASLAGAMLAMARKLYDPRMLDTIRPSGANGPRLSTWRVFTSHPDPQPLRAELRQGVGIRQATGAAASGVLYSTEALPRGTRWPFLLEVDSHRNPADARIACAVLDEWTAGRCWLGRAVARGLGWLHLENLTAVQLTTEHVDLWPDSSRPPLEIFKKIVDPEGKWVSAAPAGDVWQQLEPGKFVKLPHWLEGTRPERRWLYAECPVTICVGKRDDGFGLDGLSISGHSANGLATSWDDVHFLAPRGKDRKKLGGEFRPDHFIIMARGNGTDALEPFIPGSGLKGPLRHALSRRHRRKKEELRDPNVHEQVRDPNRREDDTGHPELDSLLGTFRSGARLLVPDAYLEKEKPAWCAAWLQHHAEDEFSAGVYGSGKFDRLVLVEGEFKTKLVLECETKDQLEALKATLEPFFAMARSGQVGLGGNAWRGAGWVRWKIDPWREGAGRERA